MPRSTRPRGRHSSSLGAERSEVRVLSGSSGQARAFVEVLEPPLRLLICGAGHDAAPLVEAAADLGWNPIVVDDRPEFLHRERFPKAADFVLVERPDKVAEVAPLDARTHVVVMTHNFLRDKDYVRSLLASPARFLAMLAPRCGPSACWPSSATRASTSRRPTVRGSGVPPGSTSAPRARRRSPPRSSPRSWP